MMIPNTIAALVAQNALFVINHSGGKDSQLMMIEMLKVIPKQQLVAIHASLGEAEWEGALEHAQQQCDAAGVPFIVARATKTFFEMVEHRFATRPEVPSFPSSATRQCTSDLKRGPCQREARAYAKANGFSTIVNCMGLRAAESPSRAKRATFSRMAISNSVHTWYEWLPIHDVSTADVFAQIAAAGQEPHPAYAAGNERLSCVFCIMASKNDLRVGAKARPDLFRRYVELEEKTGYTMHQSRVPLKTLVGEAA